MLALSLAANCRLNPFLTILQHLGNVQPLVVLDWALLDAVFADIAQFVIYLEVSAR